MNKIDTEQLKSAADILRVIQDEGVTLKKNGKSYMGLCPFHDDNNPSLSVLPDKQVFKCFGCNASGDVIKFIQMKHNLDFKQAVEYLSKKYIHTHYYSTEKTPIPHKVNDVHTKATTYLAKRGITDKSLIEKFKISYENGYVTFPFFDEQGNTGEVYSRSVNDKAKLKHKYTPGPHTGIFNLDGIKSSGEVYLCECVIDALSLYQMGMQNVTCTFGKGNLTDELKDILAKYCKLVYIVYDNDGDNDEAALKTAEQLKSKGLSCQRVKLPAEMKDCNDFLTQTLKDGKQLPEIKSLFKKLENTHYTKPSKQKANIELVEGANINAHGSFTELALISDENTALTYQIQDRKYIVRNFTRKLIGNLKILLHIENKNGYHFTNTDLGSSRARRIFASQTRERLIVSEAETDVELEQLAMKLIKVQEQAYKEKKDQDSEDTFERVYIVTPSREHTAIDLLTNRCYLTETLLPDLENLGVCGEEQNKQLYTIAGMSRMDDNPLHILVVSSSGTGKSYVQKCTLDLFPAKDVRRLSRTTAQVLFYVEKDYLMEKILSIDEMEGMMDSLYSFRILMSEKKLELLTTGKNEKGGNIAQRRLIPGPTAVFLATTSIDRVDLETRSRMIITFGDESEQQTERIKRMHMKMDNTKEGRLLKMKRGEIIQKHQDILHMIKPIDVYYASKELEEKVMQHDNHLSQRRKFPGLTSIIRNIARINMYHKKIYNDFGIDYAYIDERDYELAMQIAQGILGNQMKDLTGALLIFYRKIVEYVDKVRGDVPRVETAFSIRNIREYTGMGNTQTYDNIIKLLKLEYLKAVCGKNGSRMKFQLTDENLNV